MVADDVEPDDVEPGDVERYDDLLPDLPPSRWSRRHIGGALVGVVGLVAVGLGGVVVYDDEPEWDPRVLELVRFVERERGLPFREAVPIDFLSDAEFRKEVVADESEVTDEQRDETEQTEALFRALGLFGADVDLSKSNEQVAGEGTIGLYIPEAKRIKLRGAELTPSVRVTLAHELTHALQDQHFEIDVDELSSDSGEAGALRAVLEGDAELVAEAYTYSELDESEQGALEQAQTEGVETAYEGIPPVLQSLTAAPYQLGYGFFDLLVAVGGQAARNRAFRRPPVSDEHLLDPWTYLDGDAPLEVDVPELAKGDEPVFDDASPDFGALAWYVVLAQRLDARVALRAVDGWGGDAYVAYERGDRLCVRARFRGDDPDETAEMVEALDDWVAAGEPGSATITRRADEVELESCDRGDETSAIAQLPADVVILPAARSSVAARLVDQGLPKATARCAANRVIELYSLDRYADLSTSPFVDADFGDRLSEVVERCS